MQKTISIASMEQKSSIAILNDFMFQKDSFLNNLKLFLEDDSQIEIDDINFKQFISSLDTADMSQLFSQCKGCKELVSNIDNMQNQVLDADNVDLSCIAKLIAKNNFLDQNGELFFQILDKLQSTKNYQFYFDEKCNVFQVMTNRPFCATYNNFIKVFNVWKILFFNNKLKYYEIISNVNAFTRLSLDIPFSKSECYYFLEESQSFLDINKKPDKYFQQKYLFPFLCHLYVDYFGDIISPLKLIQHLGGQQDNYEHDLYRYYGVSYIWRLLEIAEDIDIELLPINNPNQKIEIEIFFTKENLAKEIKIENTDIMRFKTKTIPKFKILQMIQFILSKSKKDKNFINFLKADTSKYNHFYIMISQICHTILKYVQKHLPDKFPKYFNIICEAASTPNFVASSQNTNKTEYICISFLIQILIDFYCEANKSGMEPFEIQQETKFLFYNFILLGPPFFSFPESRRNNKNFLCDPKNELDQYFNEFWFLNACFPSLISQLEKNETSIKFNIANMIENDDEPKGKSIFSNIINQYFTFKRKTTSQDYDITIDIKNWQENQKKYFIDVIPFLLFKEVNPAQSPTDNHNEFHNLLKKILSKNDSISVNISEGISTEYIRNKFAIFQYKKYRKLKTLFEWYLLRFLITINESMINMNIDDTNALCKKKYFKFFIKSLPVDQRDSEVCSILNCKNSDIFLKGIEQKAKKYCKQFQLMYSEIKLINQDDLMEKLDIMISYLSSYLKQLQPDSINRINYNENDEEIKKKRSRAIEILELAIRHIKHKSDSNGKRSTLLNQMCKKIFNAFDSSLRSSQNEGETDDFVLQLFTSFAYESINIIPTKAALKKITKILNILNSQQSKIVIVSLFNFFEEKRAQRELILEISKNDKIEIAKQSVIDKNLGHLYRFENDICFDCKKKVTDDVDAGYAQFFSCGHIFHTFNCTGTKNCVVYKKCPVCSIENDEKMKKKNSQNSMKSFNNPSFDNYFDSKDCRFHSSLESISSMMDTMNFPTCISDPPISVKVNYNDVDSMFDSEEGITINFSENEF